MNERTEIKIKNYIYKNLQELVITDLKTVNETTRNNYLRNLTEDFFKYINDNIER